LALAPKLGKQSAHALVYSIAMNAADQGVPLREAVLVEPRIVAVLGMEEIAQLFDLGHGTGCCAEMVDCVLSQTNAYLNEEAHDE